MKLYTDHGNDYFSEAGTLGGFGIGSSKHKEMTRLVSDGNAEIIDYVAPPETDEAKSSRLKLEGVEFEGVMCSATSADMWGLTSVRLDYDEILAGGGTFSTGFKFANGGVLTLTTENYKELMAVWRPFRAGFFA